MLWLVYVIKIIFCTISHDEMSGPVSKRSAFPIRKTMRADSIKTGYYQTSGHRSRWYPYDGAARLKDAVGHAFARTQQP